MNGSHGPRRRNWGAPPRHTARQRPALGIRNRRRPAGLPPVAAAELPSPRTVGSGFLPDVQSCASGGGSPPRRVDGACSAPHSRTLRLVPERATGRLGSRLAGAILFLPAGRHSPLGRAALYGVESRPRRHGGRSGLLPVVERRRALRSRRSAAALG